MKNLPSFDLLVDSFSKLPGVGRKSAERMASAVLDMAQEDAEQFSKAIVDAKNRIHPCPNCGLFTENETCSYCDDEHRDHGLCIVVAKAKDADAFERIGAMNCVYHVLGGLLNPAKGIGPEDLSIDRLIERIQKEGIHEIVLAMNPTIEGETTSLFLAHTLANVAPDVQVTRLGYGLPMGASLDYADAMTLQKALEGRKSL